MPGVSRADMNGYRDFEHGHLRTSSYANGYDPYRRDDRLPSYRSPPSARSEYHMTSRSEYPPTARSDIVSARSQRNGYRRNNGIEEFEQNSFEAGMRDGNELSFEVDHLATYTSKSGTTHPEDGLNKLKQMESSTGIWTMRCLMIIERRHIIIIDKGNGDELERFPLAQLHEPTAVLKNDRKETYTNLVLFTVIDDPRRKNSPSDMHIFQSVNTPAHDIVDEILAAKGEGGGRRGPYNDRHIPPPPSGPAPEPPYGKFDNYRATHFTEPRDEDLTETRLRESRLPDTRLGDTRLGDTRLAKSSRFNDASQWIHDYYSTTNRDRSLSPVHNVHALTVTSPGKGSVRSVKTADCDEIPNFGNEFTRHESFQTDSHANKKGANAFGTWSGRNSTSKRGKKGKKWYKLGFSKTSTHKDKIGKENNGYDYSSTTLPLPSKVSSANGNYSSLSRRRVKSDTDADMRAEWGYSGKAWPNDNVEAGRGGFGATTRASYIHNSDMDTGQNEAMEKDVQLLNNCFDDIEKFVSRLQQAAEAYKELERRRLERGGKKNRKSAGDGMLMMRARPPPADDFVDIFQKFKFAFNLLAKLKAHIHDPNAPELVHFLFTPLSLIYEASRDPIHGGAELSGEAIAPLLLPDAKQLLLNCLTSKELELWQRLGKPWTLVKDEWHGYVPQYNPRFYNGWQPSPAAVDDVNYPGDRFRDEPPLIRPSERNVPYDDNRVSRRREEPYAREIRKSEREDPYSRDIRSTARDDYHSDRRGEDLRPTRNEYRSTERWDDYRSPSPPPPMRQTDYSENKRASAREPIPAAPRSRAEENSAFAKELGRMGATIYEAVHERQGKNAKEMNVEKGDIVQVLDKSRNWWKLKNYMGETGYAPYTILKEYQSRDDYDNGQGRLSGDYSSYINGNAPPPPPPPMSGSNRGGMRAEKDKRSSPRYQPQAPPAPPKSRAPERGKYSDELHHELRTKMNTSDDHLTSYGPRSPRNPPRETKVSQYSSAEEVKDWLENKGFSMRCMDLLQGYSGIDLFSLERQELERLLGREDGRHLDSLLTVQKKNAGYRTRGTSELGAILQRRKERADDDVMGMRPSFAPDSPDYSPAESDASSDDFGDAGKTLRNLLERQRKKIQSGSYQKYN